MAWVSGQEAGGWRLDSEQRLWAAQVLCFCGTNPCASVLLEAVQLKLILRAHCLPHVCFFFLNSLPRICLVLIPHSSLRAPAPQLDVRQRSDELSLLHQLVRVRLPPAMQATVVGMEDDLSKRAMLIDHIATRTDRPADEVGWLWCASPLRTPTLPITPASTLSLPGPPAHTLPITPASTLPA